VQRDRAKARVSSLVASLAPLSLVAMTEVLEHRVVARNPATDSENRIHADDVARKYGFAAGLVPGVAIYAYACAPIHEALGEEWLERGSTSMRFSGPCYDGELLTVTVEPPAAAGSGQPHLIAASTGGRTCATGTARAPAEAGAPDGIEWAPPPEERPLASIEAFAPKRLLGSVQLATDEARMASYLDSIGEPSPAYSRRRILHPGMLLSGANSILVANVVMPTWLHVESRVQHWRPVAVGEPVQVRGIVAEAFERKGHRFVAIDVAWMVGEGSRAAELVASARHTAIWQLAT
jgi:acyl dehydratase